jgi:ferrous iron transport protein A
MPAPSPYSLDHLTIGQSATVHAIHAPGDRPDWAHQLSDLGFVAGEQVQLLHRALFGGDPLVVRVGGSTYALRRAEAACVRLQPAA